LASHALDRGAVARLHVARNGCVAARLIRQQRHNGAARRARRGDPWHQAANAGKHCNALQKSACTYDPERMKMKKKKKKANIHK
jgi:hypothetical protein